MRPLLPVLSIAVILLTACTAAGVAPTPLPATPVPSAPVAPSAAAMPSTTAAGSSSSGAPAPSAAAAMSTMTPDPALEATIPEVVGDLRLDVVSLTGEEYLARSADTALASMIATADLQPADVSVAVGMGQLEGQQLAIAAFRFPGVQEATLRELFRTELIAGVEGVKVVEAQIGGHLVHVVSDPSGMSVPTYLNVEGDTARIVQASIDELAEAAVDTMP